MFHFWVGFIFLGSIFSNDSFIWKGIVIDGETGNPIQGVHVLSHNRQGISDAEGRFEIEVKIGDKITFTHVGYEKLSMVVEQDMPARVELVFSEQELDEYTVHSLPSEEQLKRLILNTPYIPTKLESNLMDNLNFTKNIYRFGNHHTQNSINQVLKKMSSGNGEATFLSTNPSMGIIGFIRSLKKKEAIPREFNSEGPHYPFNIQKLRKAARDSSVRYSNYFD